VLQVFYTEKKRACSKHFPEMGCLFSERLLNLRQREGEETQRIIYGKIVWCGRAGGLPPLWRETENTLWMGNRKYLVTDIINPGRGNGGGGMGDMSAHLETEMWVEGQKGIWGTKEGYLYPSVLGPMNCGLRKRRP